jgi:hypothetical protein
MIPNLTPTTLMMLILGVSTFILIMFLPALHELKKGRDAGPRVIMDDVIVQLFKQKAKPLATMEEEMVFDQILIKKIAGIIAILPNLEE